MKAPRQGVMILQPLLSSLEQLLDYFMVRQDSKVIYISEKLTALGAAREDGEGLGPGSILRAGGRRFQVRSRDLDAEGIRQEVLILTEQEGKDSFELLRQISQHLSEGLIVSNREGRILIYNQALAEMENKAVADMEGHLLWEAYGYNDKGGSEHLRVLKENTPIINKYEAHAVAENEANYVVYSTFPVFRDGDPLGVFSVCRNESDLKNQLEETIETKRRYAAEHIHLVSQHYKNGTSYTFSDIVGTSQRMNKLIKQAQSIAWLDNSILISGETGTGKEVLAQSIHNYGKRSNEPFIGVNCSAIPETLIESILFGSVKGAFTDAQDHPGIFEEVGKGTLFLDEMNSMSVGMQAKLLRVIQEKQYRRVGGNRDFKLECRIISGVNDTPEKLLKSGKLREDLFYRLAGFQLIIPPLREREGDLELLMDHYIRKYSVQLDRHIKTIDPALRETFQSYSWPGNIRELENTMENLLIMASAGDTVLSLSHLPEYLRTKFGLPEAQAPCSPLPGLEGNLAEVVEAVEKRLIEKKFLETGGNISRCALELGVSRQCLTYKLKKYKLMS